MITYVCFWDSMNTYLCIFMAILTVQYLSLSEKVKEENVYFTGDLGDNRCCCDYYYCGIRKVVKSKITTYLTGKLIYRVKGCSYKHIFLFEINVLRHWRRLVNDQSVKFMTFKWEFWFRSLALFKFRENIICD